MAKDSVSASFKCADCKAPITFPDNVTDATIIKCGKCGTVIGPYRDFRALAVEATRKKALGIAKRAVKGLGRKYK